MKGRLVCVAAAVVLGSGAGVSDATAGESPIVPGLGEFQVFEQARGTTVNSLGYHFTISPDESWLLVSRLASEGIDRGLTLLHMPTSKIWRLELGSDPVSRVEFMYPNCFSADSKQLYGERSVAELSPEMEALVFRAAEDPQALERFKRHFLDLPRPRKKRDGTRAETWFHLDQDEGTFGKIDWSTDGETLYESLHRGQYKRSALQVTPPDSLNGIDYGPVLEAEKRLADSVIAELEETEAELIGELPDKSKGDEFLAAMKDLVELDVDSATILLDQLAVSPDQKMLAGVVTIYRGAVGFAGLGYGVIIPLDRGGLAAFPFARNVYGKILWSRDSRRIYFYAQPTAGGGDGTIHRLDLDPGSIPRSIAPTQVPSDQWNALSDRELGASQHEQAKARHHAALVEEFQAPQRILEFKNSLGYLESGQVIFLYGTDRLSEERARKLHDYVNAKLIDRSVMLKLPVLEEFTERYIPGMRSGVFAQPEYVWPSGYGQIPVLLYHQGQLINLRFVDRGFLAGYAPETSTPNPGE